MTDALEYRCVLCDVFSLCDFKLGCAQPEQIESFRQWGNSQIFVFWQKREISSLQQMAYFETQTGTTLNGLQVNNMFLTFLRMGMLIGYRGSVYIARQDLCVQFWLLLNKAKAYASQEYSRTFRSFQTSTGEFAVEDLPLNRLFTETWSTRHSQVQELGGSLRGEIPKTHKIQCGATTDSVFHARLAVEK